MTIDQFFVYLRKLIAQEELFKVLEQLQEILTLSPQLNELIKQTGRFQTINQTRYGLLEFIGELEIQQKLPEVKAELEHTLSILQSKNVLVDSSIFAGGNVHIGDVVYQNVSLPSSTKFDYNKHLTRTLVVAMKPYHKKAEKLCLDFSWLEYPENRRRVQQFVFQHFVGEIGKQIRKLINIGDDEQMDTAKKKRIFIEKCLEIAKWTFDLVNYTLLSCWWDYIKINPRTLNLEQKKTLSVFFEKHLEYNLEDQFFLLQSLSSIFNINNVRHPFWSELNLNMLQNQSALHLACKQLEQMVSIGDCEKAEHRLGEILEQFSFLTTYRMASIKKIGYRQIRNGQPEYLHRYVALGIDIKFSEDAEKGRWITLGEQTPAILLYQGEDYKRGINLFPFIIDYNALILEQGAKICFFSVKDLNDDNTLEYRFLGDNSIVRIEKQGICTPETNLNELMMIPENLKTLNLDCVVDAFQDARQAILGMDRDSFDVF